MTKARLLTLFPGVFFLTAWIPSNALAQKPPLTFDEFFNSVEIRSVKLSPEGGAVVIATERADWENNRWRNDLWLYRIGGDSGSLIPLTQSGHDTQPEWSPDGRWIAFLSEREAPQAESDDDKKRPERIKQIYAISPNGGEAFPVTRGDEEVHAFAWSADSRTIYFATRNPWTKEQKEAYKKEWKDVLQYRESERGDTISSVEIASVMASGGVKSEDTPKPAVVGTTPYRVDEMIVSPDGRRLAFATISISKRQDSMEPYGIYLITLPSGPKGEARLLSRTQAVYKNLHWTPDSRHIYFQVELGAVEGEYRDYQPRVYWLDRETGAIARWGAKFTGALTGYAVAPDGSLLAAGRLGTQVEPYVQESPAAEFGKLAGWPGTYERLATAAQSPRVAFVYSTLQKPAEVYLAESAAKLGEARPITSFNHLFTERALPEGKPYRWAADDGTTVEGMLIYPPGKLGAGKLPMFTLIHGGPADADGDHFEAGWYQWAALAATHGWLVFEPNYRGSVGYGDNFALEIIPHLVSRPGKDILEGVDALVNEGIADPSRLTIGGYSYGGYMTNWLITQTARFKAAVTGAGAVEHAANWGNDDVSFDDAYFLGGLPWEAEKNTNDEAALWQMNRVRTPTHMVAGENDIRVYVGEDYLLERALHALGIPSTLLIFPGEGHSLDKNPWHGKIKVREELKWLEKYGGK